MQWLLSAHGSYDRAASALVSAIRNSDLDDMEQCRIINNRIMRVKMVKLFHSFLDVFSVEKGN